MEFIFIAVLYAKRTKKHKGLHFTVIHEWTKHKKTLWYWFCDLISEPKMNYNWFYLDKLIATFMNPLLRWKSIKIKFLTEILSFPTVIVKCCNEINKTSPNKIHIFFNQCINYVFFIIWGVVKQKSVSVGTLKTQWPRLFVRCFDLFMQTNVMQVYQQISQCFMRGNIW